MHSSGIPYVVLLTMANPPNIRGAPAGDAEAAEHAEPSTSPQEDAGGNIACILFIYSHIADAGSLTCGFTVAVCAVHCLRFRTDPMLFRC